MIFHQLTFGQMIVHQLTFGQMTFQQLVLAKWYSTNWFLAKWHSSNWRSAKWHSTNWLLAKWQSIKSFIGLAQLEMAFLRKMLESLLLNRWWITTDLGAVYTSDKNGTISQSGAISNLRFGGKVTIDVIVKAQERLKTGKHRHIIKAGCLLFLRSVA